MIVCLTPPQMDNFCDLLGTPDAPVSKIASVKIIDCQVSVKTAFNYFYLFSVERCNTTIACTEDNQECNVKAERCVCKPNFEEDKNGDCKEKGRKNCLIYIC